MSQALVELVREKFPEAVLASHSHRGDEVITVRREDLVAVVGFLRNDPQAEMKLLRQIAAIDMLTYKSEMSGGSALASIEAPAYELQHKPRSSRASTSPTTSTRSPGTTPCASGSSCAATT